MPNLDSYKHLISYVAQDTTQRFSCRKGDFLFWLRWKNIFADPDSALSIEDFWEMRDGDQFTITNRTQDLPVGFNLHPTEVKDSLVSWMMSRIQAGDEPQEITDGPGLWRIITGDRLIWIGDSRPGYQATDSILAILEFRECALIFGESNQLTVENQIGFGRPSKPRLSANETFQVHNAFNLAKAMGIPDSWDTEWQLG